MKKIIRVLFIPLVISMMFGFVFGKLLYGVYSEEIESKLSSSKLYLIQNGEYESYDMMREENNGNNYVYYMDDGGYKTVVGITRDESNVEKIKKLYSDIVSVEEYYISSEFLNDKQSEYDLILNNTDDVYEVKKVVDDILSLYREDDTVRLVLVN